MNPRVILFDEPFLGLDPRSQTWLVNTMQLLKKAGKSIIVATHTLDLVPRIADSALVLSEEHRVLAKGAVEHVFLNEQLLIRANLIEEGNGMVNK